MSYFTRILGLLLLSACSLFLPLHASAANPPSSTSIFNQACTGQAASSPVCQDAKNQSGSSQDNPIAGKNGIVQRAANLIAMVGGVAAVIVIIISGAMYATAGGAGAGQRAGDNPAKAKNARATMINALIGLVIIASAWAIVSFVVQKVIS